MLRSFVREGGKRVLYQEGPLAKIRAPRELIAAGTGGKKLPRRARRCSAAPCPAIGAIRPSPRFEMEIEDPVLGRKLAHAYDVQRPCRSSPDRIAWLPCREALARPAPVNVRSAPLGGAAK